MKTAEKILEKVRDELLKQLHPMIHTKGYPSEAVPKGTILEIPQLLKDEISSLLEAEEKESYYVFPNNEEIKKAADEYEHKAAEMKRKIGNYKVCHPYHMNKEVIGYWDGHYWSFWYDKEINGGMFDDDDLNWINEELYKIPHKS